MAPRISALSCHVYHPNSLPSPSPPTSPNKSLNTFLLPNAIGNPNLQSIHMSRLRVSRAIFPTLERSPHTFYYPQVSGISNSTVRNRPNPELLLASCNPNQLPG